MAQGDVAPLRVKELCSVHSGYTVRGRIEPSPVGVLAIQPGDLGADGTFDVETLMRVDAPVGRYEVHPGDVLFRSRGQNTFAWAVPDSVDEPAIAVMPLFVIRPHSDFVDSRYLAWALNQRDAQQHFRQSSQGQTIQMVSKRVLEDAPLTVPSLIRQRQVVAAAELSARQVALERRLVQRRYDLLSLQLVDVARAFSDSPNQNRTS